MGALICRGGGQVARSEDAPEPEVPEGWARVRVRRAGICHTDLELARGYKGFAGVLGLPWQSVWPLPRAWMSACVSVTTPDDGRS